MFTGIVEEVGRIKQIRRKGKARVLVIESKKIIDDIKIGDSVSVNGVCLTVIKRTNSSFEVEAVEETLRKTNIGDLKVNSPVNLELALKLGERLGGHIVQGHVDTTGEIAKISKLENSWIFEIKFPSKFRKYIIPIGSIAVDGISLTVAGLEEDKFRVSIIPHTWENTNLKFKKVGDKVNIEFDVIGKYVENFLTLKNSEGKWQGG